MSDNLHDKDGKKICYITAIRRAEKECRNAYEVSWPYLKAEVQVETYLLEARKLIDHAIQDLRRSKNFTQHTPTGKWITKISSEPVLTVAQKPNYYKK